MITYLYVKTHTKTGLKYLGITKSKDPHKYKGSGTDWKLHLSEHGATYTTEIIKECDTQEMVKHWGRYYSELWDVVASTEWANRTVEMGTGWGPRSPESIAKQKATRQSKGRYTQTPESIAKRLETRAANGTNARSPESIAKQIASRAANGTLNTNSSESIAKQISTRIANGTMNNYSPEANAKRLATMKLRGTMNSHTPEANAKRSATRARNKVNKLP